MLTVKELKEMEEGKLGGAIRAARLAQHISQEEIGTNRLIRVNLRRLNAFVPFLCNYSVIA